jgi:hypothetical protein
MALDIYWELARNRTWIGSLEIDTPLENLLYEFGKSSGVLIDPYGKGRIYLNQWAKLIKLATDFNYPAQLLREIQARIPTPDVDGIITTVGD